MGPTGTTTRENGVCADALEKHSTGVFAGILKHNESWHRYQILGLSHFPSLPCKSSRGSAYLAVPPGIHRWQPGHLHTGFPKDVQCELLGRGLPELQWTVRGSDKSLGEYPLSHWILHSGKNQHASAIFIKFSMSHTSHSSIPCLQRAHQITRVGTRSNVLSRSTKSYSTVSCWCQGIFL